MFKNLSLTLFLGFAITFSVFAHSLKIDKVCPPHWWVGMVNPDLQILFYGEHIGEFQVKVDYPGVIFKGARQVENPNYLFVDLVITPEAKVGTVSIVFESHGTTRTYSYSLKRRQGFDNRILGLDPSDFIYLILPDRFANGDTKNDKVKGLHEAEAQRDQQYGRHGGDIQGILQKMDYLQELGVTALWLNPVLTNDQPKESYHGYAATDHYEVDPRLGGNQQFQYLIDECHKRGIKMIMDIIHNHNGNEHWLIKDLPMKDWVHQHDEFTRTTYRAPTIFDPYASEYDRSVMKEGWFDHHMPDLNQDNEYVATYLIQNNIWWIENSGIDGFRMDTYAYSDESFLEKWGEAILDEYPHFGIFGETWVHGTPTQAYFHGQTNIQSGFNSNLPGLTDFQLYYAINAALNEPFGWTEGVAKLYYTLAKDYIYKDASRNVLFLDNHDLGRFYSTVKEDIDKYKMGIGLIMTLRGIPCMYYGTEILMKNDFDWGNHDSVREEFPGGWKDNESNKFTKAGRTEQEQEAFEYVQTLAKWRQNAPAIHSGKLMQFVPYDGVYVYFRYHDDQTVMVVLNSNDKEMELDTKNYAERMNGFTKGKNVVTEKDINDLSKMALPAMSITILELR